MRNTYSFFSRFRKVIESPNPAKASSAMNEILFARKSKWRNLCKGFRASVGIVWMLLSPKRRYCKFSGKNNVVSAMNFFLCSMILSPSRCLISLRTPFRIFPFCEQYLLVQNQITKHPSPGSVSVNCNCYFSHVSRSNMCRSIYVFLFGFNNRYILFNFTTESKKCYKTETF